MSLNPDCLHCAVHQWVLDHGRDGDLEVREVLSHLMQAAGEIVRSCPENERGALMVHCIRFFVENAGGQVDAVTAQPMRAH